MVSGLALQWSYRSNWWNEHSSRPYRCHPFPIVFELVPANIDERLVAERVLYALRGCSIYADKGFIGEDRQKRIYQHTHNRIYTDKRSNQTEQNPIPFDRWLNSIWEWIEGVFNEVQNTSRNIECLLAKTVVGLSTRVIAKLISHLFKFILRKFYCIDVQTFTQSVLPISHRA